MKWYKGNKLPEIEKETQLCVVQYKYPVNEDEGIYERYYDLMLFHRSTKSFSKKEDEKGIIGLKQELIIKWAYIEEDDDLIEEEIALEAVSAGIVHVKNLIQLLLTDCIVTPKEYREKIGLDDLFSFEKKIANRIEEIEEHWSD